MFNLQPSIKKCIRVCIAKKSVLFLLKLCLPPSQSQDLGQYASNPIGIGIKPQILHDRAEQGQAVVLLKSLAKLPLFSMDSMTLFFIYIKPDLHSLVSGFTQLFPMDDSVGVK